MSEGEWCIKARFRWVCRGLVALLSSRVSTQSMLHVGGIAGVRKRE